MTEQQFLRQIKRLLHCKADKKREILRQLESDIASAKEGGKSCLLVNLMKMDGAYKKGKES